MVNINRVKLQVRQTVCGTFSIMVKYGVVLLKSPHNMKKVPLKT